MFCIPGTGLARRGLSLAFSLFFWYSLTYRDSSTSTERVLNIYGRIYVKTLVMLAVVRVIIPCPDIFSEAAQKISELGVFVNIVAEGV